MQQQDEGEATVVAMAGDLGGNAADELRHATARAARASGRVVFEMTGVTALPAPVVGVLVGAWHTLNDRLTLKCSAPVFDVLEHTGLDRLLPVA
jgi:anti-anti-sigma factor